MIKTVPVIGIFIVFIALAAAFFRAPEFGGMCADDVISCLTQAADKSFWGRVGGAFSCIFQNTVCVFRAVIAVF